MLAPRLARQHTEPGALTVSQPRPTITALMSASTPAPHRVAFLGFSDSERSSLSSYFRLAASRVPRFEPVYTLTDADYLVADADHGPSVQLVLVTERLAETVFIGAQPPPGAAASMLRPIDALQVMRALQALVGLAPSQPDAPPPSMIAEAMAFTVTPELRSVRLRPVDAPEGDEPAAPIRPSAPPRAPVMPAADVELLAQPRALRESPAPNLPPPTPPVPPPLARPAAVVRQAPAREPVAAPPPGVFVGPPPPPRALLVDDSAIALRFLDTRLKPWGLRTDLVTTSQLALERLAQRSYELIFLDVELGPASELDGLTLCQQIKHSAAAVSSVVVIVSAHHSQTNRARGALAGCDHYLPKPIKEADLAKLLKRQGLTLLAPSPRPAAARATTTS